MEEFRTDLKFFTNEPDRDLYTRFNKILQTNTQFFDVLVGYFRSSGFFKLYPAMNDIKKIRILIGLNTDKYTVDIINESKQLQLFEAATVKEAKEGLSDEIEREFESVTSSAEIEEGVRVFIDWLKSGKMELRMYTEDRIHAKVYIMRKDMEKSDTYGSVITGSSNFSSSGLVNNLEFNVELKDSADVKFALSRFEELWEKSVPITDTYIDAVEKKTWMRNDITPYEIYLKTIYEFFKEEINSDKDLLANNLFPDGYMQLQYQLDAVVQAKKILEAYNGVFISDVVGLGKTYICSMLAKTLKGKKLVVCPPVLVNYWDEVLREFDVAAKVESLGKLDRILDSDEKFDYVFVDEAHRFRNAGTESFSKLHEICYGKKVVLISATPINNYSSDIENQLYLFQPKHNSNIVGVKNLEGFFASLKGKLVGLEKGSEDYMSQLRINSEEIRDKLLRHIMIRRTRNEIKEYYSEDLEKQGLTFPKLGSPEQIVYEFDEITDKVFTETIEAIKNFTYSRYKPLVYLKNQAQYATLIAGSHNMGGFMKGILVKRLESSFFAFRNTLSRFEESYEKFIDMYEKGEVYISKKVDVYELLDSGDDDALMRLVEEENVMHFKANAFKSEFIIDLKKDLSTLNHLQSLWDLVTTDPKLEKFENELKNNKKLSLNKKIIFTESKETAEYLEKQLRDIYGSRVIAYSGASGSRLKEEIENSFNPKMESLHNDKYDVLVTTDVLAEGINLHRSNALINYDLPWNPTRIMQRVGRINRVGTEFDEIFVFNFFPTAQSSKQIPLKDRILAKLQAFHDTLGEDYKYLSDEEEVSSQKLFDDLNKNLEDDEEGSNPELAYLALIRKIRDNNSDLFERIKRLPKKSKTGKISKEVRINSTLTFMKKGALKLFFLSDGKTPEELSFLDSIKYLECEYNEQKLSVGKEYYSQNDQNTNAFDDYFVHEKIITNERAVIKGNDAKIMKYLRALETEKTLTDDQEIVVKRLIKAYENGDVPQNVSKNVVKVLKNVKDIAEAYFTITNNIPDEYLHERKDAILKTDGVKEVILSCYLVAKK